MRKIYQCIVVAIVMYSIPCFSQGDTVRYRYIRSILSDSTRFLYEIGSLELKNQTGIKYLRFSEPMDSTSPESFFRSSPFIISSSTDSLGFFRFANFDDKNYIRRDTATIGTASFDSLIARIRVRYDSNFKVMPLPTHFNSNSYVLYIVEIRNFSNNDVVVAIDTTKCFLVNGVLKWTTYPQSKSIRKIGLSNIPVDTPVFLAVRREYSLPSQGSFIGHVYTEARSNKPARNNFKNLSWVANPPMPITSGLHANEKIPNRLSVLPNPSNGSFIVKLSSPVKSSGFIEIYNSAGGLEFKETISINVGENSYLFHNIKLSAGVYRLYLYSEKENILSTVVVTN